MESIQLLLFIIENIMYKSQDVLNRTTIHFLFSSRELGTESRNCEALSGILERLQLFIHSPPPGVQPWPVIIPPSLAASRPGLTSLSSHPGHRLWPNQTCIRDQQKTQNITTQYLINIYWLSFSFRFILFQTTLDMHYTPSYIFLMFSVREYRRALPGLARVRDCRNARGNISQMENTRFEKKMDEKLEYFVAWALTESWKGQFSNFFLHFLLKRPIFLTLIIWNECAICTPVSTGSD